MAPALGDRRIARPMSGQVSHGDLLIQVSILSHPIADLDDVVLELEW